MGSVDALTTSVPCACAPVAPKDPGQVELPDPGQVAGAGGAEDKPDGIKQAEEGAAGTVMGASGGGDALNGVAAIMPQLIEVLTRLIEVLQALISALGGMVPGGGEVDSEQGGDAYDPKQDPFQGDKGEVDSEFGDPTQNPVQGEVDSEKGGEVAQEQGPAAFDPKQGEVDSEQGSEAKDPTQNPIQGQVGSEKGGEVAEENGDAVDQVEQGAAAGPVAQNPLQDPLQDPKQGVGGVEGAARGAVLLEDWDRRADSLIGKGNKGVRLTGEDGFSVVMWGDPHIIVTDGKDVTKYDIGYGAGRIELSTGTVVRWDTEEKSHVMRNLQIEHAAGGAYRVNTYDGESMQGDSGITTSMTDAELREFADRLKEADGKWNKPLVAHGDATQGAEWVQAGAHPAAA